MNARSVSNKYAIWVLGFACFALVSYFANRCLATTNVVARIKAISLVNGVAMFSVTGTPGAAYVFEASTNLTDWSVLTVTISSSVEIGVPPTVGYWTFFITPEGIGFGGDGEAVRFPMRFYRLRITNEIPVSLPTNLVVLSLPTNSISVSLSNVPMTLITRE